MRAWGSHTKPIPRGFPRPALVLLGWMVAGLLLSQTVCLDQWKRAIPLGRCLAASWQHRCRRWLSNGRIDVEELYGPLVLWAIQQWQKPGQTLHLALDTTMLWNRFFVVVLSVVCHGRAIPLLWQTLEHPSASVSAEVVIALLQREPQELLVAMPGLALGDHLAGGDIQRSKQGGGAVADVVMGDVLHVAQAHRQQRLGAVQCLDLRLLVNAEHHRLVGRVQLQAHDACDLLDKERIGGDLVAEGFREAVVLLPVGLDRESLQPAMHSGFGDPCRRSQSPGTPVGAAIGRAGLQSPVDHLRDLVVFVSARPARAELIIQTFQAELQVALAPLADGHARQTHPFGDGGVCFASTAGQHRSGRAARSNGAVNETWREPGVAEPRRR